MMIITCEKCYSKFKVDDERIKETGSKVRCSKCKHIFSVFLTPVEPIEQDPIPSVSEDQSPPESSAESEESEELKTPFELGEEEESLDFDFLEKEGEEEEAPSEESLEFDLEDLELEPSEGEGTLAEETPVSEAEALDEASLELGIEDLEDEKGTADESALPEVEGLPEESLELELEDIESGEGEEGLAEEAPSETVSSESESLEEETTEASLDLTLEKEDDEASEEKVEAGGMGEESDIKLSDDAIVLDDTGEMQTPPDKEELASIEEDDLALGDISEEEVSREEIESSAQWKDEEAFDPSEIKEMEEIPFDEESEEIEEASPEAAPVPTPSQKKKRPSLLLLILFIVISIGGGIYAGITFFEPLKSGFKIPYFNITIGGERTEQKDPGHLKIALLNTKGYFEENEGTGTLFIIQGHVRNDYSKDRSFVRVKAILYDKTGKVVRTKSVYCGNVLTKTEIEDLTVAEINKKLLLQSGMNQSNVKISPNKMIPFMVVFEDLPSELGEFSVEVEGSVAG